MNCVSVLAGGWAVWRHGYVGRVTEHVDIALPADRIDAFLRVAAVSGFEVLAQAGRAVAGRKDCSGHPAEGGVGTASRLAPAFPNPGWESGPVLSCACLR